MLEGDAGINLSAVDGVVLGILWHLFRYYRCSRVTVDAVLYSCLRTVDIPHLYKEYFQYGTCSKVDTGMCLQENRKLT